MDENSRWYLLSKQALFLGCALLILFFQMLPLKTGLPSPLDGKSVLPAVMDPDWILCLTFAWVLRRPDFAPLILIAIIALLSDLLTQRPPGLWALLTLLGAEILRARTMQLPDFAFGAEWASVAAAMISMMLINRVVCAILFLDYPPLGPELVHLLSTILVYPLVAIVTHFALGVRRPTPRDQASGRGLA